MSTLDEISGEIKQKTQGAVQFLQQAQHLFEYFAKLAGKEDNAADNLISQALDNGELSSFSRRAAGADYAGSSSIRQFSSAPDISELNFNFFTGQTTDLSYFSQSDTMPLSAIRNIGDENIKEAVKQNFDKAAQQGLIELDGDNIRITSKGKDYISQPDFIKAAQADQTAAYQRSVAKMASANTAENEVQMCVGLRGNYFNDFSVFNHTDSIDLLTVINHPDKKTAKQILSNVKKWQSGGFVTVKDGVATITQNGKAVLASAGFKAASVPLTEGTVAAVGNVPGAVIVATKKVVTAVAKAVQTAAATQKR